MSAESIAKALRGYRAGKCWMARCPAHDDHTPSLEIQEVEGGRVFIHCHAGCPRERVTAALDEKGVLGDAALAPAPRPPEQLRRDGAGRTKAALGIWEEAETAGGTLVETYLRTRGLREAIPAALRFHHRLKHASGRVYPAMVALVTHGSSGEPQGIHRTFLAEDGSGKAPVETQKMMLGPCGGGAVRLAEPGDVLMVGEGIETCLSVMQATGQPAWAALSTSGLRALNLPDDVRNIIVLADGDDPGEKAARDCALRWLREGRRVRIARPPTGLDFNDMLLGRVAGQEDVE